MIACFFGKTGHVAIVLLEQHRTVNSEWYTTICMPVVFQEVRKTNRQRRITLHHDNTTSHTSAHTTAFLSTQNIDLMSHPKLKGNAKNLIDGEFTIAGINKLKVDVKAELVWVLSAKLMSIKQSNKTPTSYCTEIENLAKSLQTAYISDGLSCELAAKYSTQVAVKAITNNF